MEWQAVVLAMQILLLAIGWVLFQRARGELSARAAEAPVLTEVKTLQNNIRKLLEELEHTGDEKALHLEQRCEEARILLETLDSRLSETDQLVLQIEATLDRQNEALSRNLADHRHSASQPVSLRLTSENTLRSEAHFTEGIDLPMTNSTLNRNLNAQQRRHLVFTLADAGEGPAAIARAAQLSEGEVETLLGLRLQRK